MVEENGEVLCVYDQGIRDDGESGQAMEITTEHIDLEFLPISTDVERGVRNLEFVLQQIHAALMALTSYEADDIVANSRKNPLEAWRNTARRQEVESGICFARSFLLEVALLELQAGIERCESCVSRYEKKLRDTH